MKKLITFLALLLINSVLVAYTPVVPEKMSYQAVVRNSSNALVANQQVGMKINILQTSATGTLVYAETQKPTSNTNGLVNIVIGTGVVVSGTFSTIDWSKGPYFIKTEIDPAGGMSYSITTTSELMSVPYALYAKEAEKSGLTLPYEGTASGFFPYVLSITNTGSGHGIYGKGLVGIHGESEISNGIGLYGLSLSNTAVYGKGKYAIKGESENANGISVRGQQLNNSGYSGYFDGGKFFIDGRTGIGTTAPGSGLHIKGTGYPESFLYIQSNTTGQDAGIRLYESTTAKWHIFNNATVGGLHIYNTASKTAIFCEQATANVGIGRTDPGFDLDVYGNIRATGSVYYGSSPSVMYNKPDYVFGESYEVLGTDEVEEYLNLKKHLPWITSAEKEKEENGDVIDMTRLAFETVESLENIQLQIIEQSKIIKKIQAENEQLKTENKVLKITSEKNEARLKDVENLLLDLIKK